MLQPGRKPHDLPHPTRTPPAPGTLCRVQGERGVFIFVYEQLSLTGATSWYLIHQATQQYRAFRPEHVTVPQKKPKQLQLEEQIR